MRSMMRFMAAAAVVICVPFQSSAHSLADALAYAYDNSDLLDQQRFLLRAQDEDRRDRNQHRRQRQVCGIYLPGAGPAETRRHI